MPIFEKAGKVSGTTHTHSLIRSFTSWLFSKKAHLFPEAPLTWGGGEWEQGHFSFSFILFFFVFIYVFSLSLSLQKQPLHSILTTALRNIDRVRGLLPASYLSLGSAGLEFQSSPEASVYESGWSYSRFEPHRIRSSSAWKRALEWVFFSFPLSSRKVAADYQ